MTPPLFDIARTKKPAYWQCMKLVAPSEEDKPWTSLDALSAYCTECNTNVTFSKGSINGVHRHMKRYHRDLLDTFVKTDVKTERKVRTKKKSSKQKIGEDLLYQYVYAAGTDVVNNEQFKNLLQYVNRISTTFVLPNELEVKMELVHKWNSLKLKMIEYIKQYVDTFMVYVDVWEKGYMAVSVHYVKKDFVKESFLLAIEKCVMEENGRRKLKKVRLNCSREELAKKQVDDILERFGLQNNKVMVATFASLEDESNFQVVPHSECIGMLLHRCVMPIVCHEAVCAEYDTTSGVSFGDVYAANVADDTSSKIMVSMLCKVSRLEKFVKKHQILLSSDLSALLHVNEWKPLEECNWVDQISKINEIVNAQHKLQDWCASIVQHDASYLSMDINITAQEWAILDGLRCLLILFQKLSTTGKDSHSPTMVHIMPTLLTIQHDLGNTNMFKASKEANSYSPWMIEFKSRHDDQKYMTENVWTCLESFRYFFATRLNRMFEPILKEYGWTVLLNPNFRHFNSISKKAVATYKEQLILHLTKISTTDSTLAATNEYDLSLSGDVISHANNKLALIESEVERYLDPNLSVQFNEVVLFWWKTHETQFPHIATLARNYLSIPARKTASDRIISLLSPSIIHQPFLLNQEHTNAQMLLKINSTLMPYWNLHCSTDTV